MKTVDKSAMTTRNFDELVSQFLEDEKLNEYAMQCVRGGDGDGGGDLIIIPKPLK